MDIEHMVFGCCIIQKGIEKKQNFILYFFKESCHLQDLLEQGKFLHSVPKKKKKGEKYSTSYQRKKRFSLETPKPHKTHKNPKSL